jgi:hypothetical protein
VLLTNDTGAAAHLYTVNLLEPELRACAIVKKTYDLAPDGSLVESSAPMPLVADQFVTEFGHFHGELFFRKRGIDVCVLGTAKFDTPVRHGRVSIEVGTWKHEMILMGDRTWLRERSGDLVASAPALFQEMPLGYSRAFGGAAEVNGEEVAWPENPAGRGYYESAEQALGNPLPNLLPLQSPAQPRWNTRLPVVGWGPYPNYWGLRSARAVEVDPKTGEIVQLTPEIFNHAHPDLILDRIDPGCPVRVTGLRNKPIAFAVPREHPVVEAMVGSAVSRVDGDIDGVFLWADAGRVVLTWRARFHYPVRAEEIRRAVLTFTRQ